MCHCVHVIRMFSALPPLSLESMWALPCCLSLISVWTLCSPLKFSTMHLCTPSAPRCLSLRFDSLSCYGQLADPQIMPLSLFEAAWYQKKKKKTIGIYGSSAEQIEAHLFHGSFANLHIWMHQYVVIASTQRWTCGRGAQDKHEIDGRTITAPVTVFALDYWCAFSTHCLLLSPFTACHQCVEIAQLLWRHTGGLLQGHSLHVDESLTGLA